MSFEKGDYLCILRKYLIIVNIAVGGGPHHTQLVEEMYQDLKLAHYKLSPADQHALGLPTHPFQHHHISEDVISAIHMKK